MGIAPKMVDVVNVQCSSVIIVHLPADMVDLVAMC